MKQHHFTTRCRGVIVLRYKPSIIALLYIYTTNVIIYIFIITITYN